MDLTDRISELTVSAYTVPTDLPESDGTLKWDSTTLVLVKIEAGGCSGLGYTYGDMSIASFIFRVLRPVVLNQSPYTNSEIFNKMLSMIRNEGECGMAYMAISAVDVALWDLKAKLLGLPLCTLIGQARRDAKVYGSGGFTSYTDEQLRKQLGGWAQQGFSAFKIKIGRQRDQDPKRIALAREVIGRDADLFIDANGAFHPKKALQLLDRVSSSDVSWFEEPVSSDDLPGMAFVRERSSANVWVAAGEYGYNPGYFKKMLQHHAVDVLQADATRCGGITGFMKAAVLSEAFHIPFSFHCAPALHLHPALCVNGFYIGEYFHDHARIEQMFFDGASPPVNGYLEPDLSRPGLGLNFKYQDAERFRVS
ncbi:MAG TPA: enolase C-terminal domain-like protein [Mucilaginibacter sp.]|nr:enolase C-terminal domain-like protein [Mucilaginibacter sp.]